VNQLTVNYSPALADLLQSGSISIDGIEVGSWYTPEQVRSFRRTLPDLPFTYHAGSLATSLQTKWITFTLLQDYLAATGSPWLSLHIELLPVYIYVLGSRLGIHLPPPKTHTALQQFLELFDSIRSTAGVPLLLENLMSLRQPKYHYAADPQTISEIIERTGASLLLDISHARIAAAYREQHVHDYIECLPLDKVEQIHVSGARRKNGLLYDAHEPMQEEDYQLLEWVLGKCQPKAVTLEYFREKQALREQLARLRTILGGDAGG
jgi:hypothetical protein